MTHPNLSPAERKRIKEQLFEEKKKSFVYVTEALREADNETGTLWFNAWLNRDFYMMGEMQERAVREYIEQSPELEQAESDFLASKEMNGRGWLEA